MSEHALENPSWPWPTLKESERLTSLLKEPGVLIEEQRHPEAIHVRRPDGHSLWATMLDPMSAASARTLDGPLLSLLYPVIAEDRAGLHARVRAIAHEARAYGAYVRERSPRRRNPYLDAELNDLKRQSESAFGRTRGEPT